MGQFSPRGHCLSPVLHAAGTSQLVLDTHAAVWFLHQDIRLSEFARMHVRAALASGHTVYVPSICLVELVYLVEKGRVPAVVAERVGQVLTAEEFGFRLAPLDRNVAEATRRIGRADVPDLPDRVIAATAVALGLPLVTRDGKIRSADVHTIW